MDGDGPVLKEGYLTRRRTDTQWTKLWCAPKCRSRRLASCRCTVRQGLFTYSKDKKVDDHILALRLNLRRRKRVKRFL